MRAKDSCKVWTVLLVLVAATYVALGVPSRSKGVPNGWIEDFNEAKSLSAKEGKHILMCSVRSDRMWDKRLIQNVFSQSKFTGKAKKRFVIMMADFADDARNLSTVAMRQNPDIRDMYRLYGNGTACVIDCDGHMLQRLSDINGNALSCWLRIDNETLKLPAARKKGDRPQQAAPGVAGGQRLPVQGGNVVPRGTAATSNAELDAGNACAVVGDWRSALEHFKTTTSRQGVIAKYELGGTANARQLADAWWKAVSLAHDADTRSAYQAHAAALYQQALCEGILEGERKAVAMQRMEEAEKAGVCSRPDNMVRYGRYCVIDLSAGPNAAKYPVFYLGSEPSGGWKDEHKTTKLVLRRIEPGSFIMGEDQNDESHRVTLTKPFYIGVFEVTQKQYELVTGENPAYHKGYMRPVDNVSWDAIHGDSSTYNWPGTANVGPSSFMGLLQARTGLRLDLPTEAQWEYACRAGTKSKYNNGGDAEDDMMLLGRFALNQKARFRWETDAELARHIEDGKGGCLQCHTIVGSYLPNAWGLYDMHGNVSEWCLDWYEPNLPSGTTDPVGPSSGSVRTIRCGSWASPARACNVVHRLKIRPQMHAGVFGFRVCSALAKDISSTAPASKSEIKATPPVTVSPQTAMPAAPPRRRVSSDKLYCVIDLSAGASAASYPVSYLRDVPGNEWPDEYKTKKLVLRRVEPGTFIVGSTGRCATISKPYYIGVFEVTQSQWELVMGENPSSMKGSMRPVEGVSFNNTRGGETDADAASFVGRLRARTSLDVDLPDPERWEYACRAGTTSKFYNGCNSESEEMWQLGRFYLNQSLKLPIESADADADAGGTHQRPDGRGGFRTGHTAAGSYLPNDWQLYDMHGNVAEMCLGAEGMCVLRGGSWADSESRSGTCFLTSSAWKTKPRSVRENWIGLRLIIGISK